MALTKKIQYDQPVELLLTPRQKELIIEHAFADPELTAKLEIAETRGKKIVANYTLDDLDQLSEFVAAEANHCEDKKLKRELGALFSEIRIELDRSSRGPARGFQSAG